MSQSDLKSRINWPSTFAEVGLILVGLLLAFSVDRVWEYRQDRHRELGHIARLHEDFTATVSNLDTAIAYQDAVLHSGRVVLEALADPSAPDAAARFVAAIPAVFDFRTPTIYTTAYGDLESSGDLGLIQDQELRLALAEFEAIRERDLALIEDINRDEWIHLVRPLVGSRLPSDLYMSPEHRAMLGVPGSPFHWDLRELNKDLEFWNLITHRMIVAGGGREIFASTRQVAGRVVDLTTP